MTFVSSSTQEEEDEDEEEEDSSLSPPPPAFDAFAPADFAKKRKKRVCQRQ